MMCIHRLAFVGWFRSRTTVHVFASISWDLGCRVCALMFLFQHQIICATCTALSTSTTPTSISWVNVVNSTINHTPLARLYHLGSNLHFNLSMWCLKLLYIWVKLQGHPSRFLRLTGEGYSFALTLSGELPGQQRLGRSAENLRKIPLRLRTVRYFGKR